LTEFALPLAGVAGVLILAGGVGWGVAAALLPSGPPFRLERLAWGFAAGLALLAASVPLAFALRLSPGFLPFLALAGLALLASRIGRPAREGAVSRKIPADIFSRILLAVLLLGVALYLLRALTEPMWASDFLSNWGLKGKTIFAERQVPGRFFQWLSLRFSHPEYPLGLPLLYAGMAFLLGRWDDHAMALLFPLLQISTLLLLYGWLRRRGASRALALAAAALLSQFEPLYRAFTTGMAEVPLSFALLLLGTSLSDRLDSTDGAASRRLALASLLCAATKNEGLFLVLAAVLVSALLALGRRGRFPRPVAAALLLPAAAILIAHRLLRGSLPLIDYDFRSLLSPARLLPRLWESVESALAQTPPAAWAGVAALLLLFAAGRATPAGDRLLALAACGMAAYLFLPALALAQPAWLVHYAFFRTSAALVPLAAAGLAVRLTSGAGSGSEPGPGASGKNPGPPRPSTRAS